MKKRAPPAVKPKVKEAEKVVFHKFPQPEQYRNRRIWVREAVVAASDSPDKAHAWLGKVWEKDASETELRDPEGFSTLDTQHRVHPGHTWGSGDIPRLVCFRPPAWEMHRLRQRRIV